MQLRPHLYYAAQISASVSASLNLTPLLKKSLGLARLKRGALAPLK